MSSSKNQPSPLFNPRFVLKNLLAGLLFGLGFAIPFFTVQWLGYKYVIGELESMLPDFEDSVMFGPDSGLSIVSHELSETEDGRRILGTVRNNGQVTWDSVTFGALFYDPDDKVLDQCEGNIFIKLSPGQDRVFSIRCYGTLPFERFAVEILDALSY